MATSILRNRQRDAARIISRFVGFIDEDFVIDILKISPKYCAKVTDEYILSTMAFVRVLKSLGYISRDISAGEIFDTSLIEKVHPEEGHYDSGKGPGADAA
jgi:NitT/TauT family transport system substrate-binding protein